MNLLACIYVFVTALCTALLLVPFLRRWALDKNEVDSPDERKVHNVPTPRLGGIAIFLAFFIAVLIFAPPSPHFRGLLAGSLVVFATGLADDLQGLSSRQKFLGLFVGSLVTITVGNLWIHDLGNLFGFGRILLPIWFGVPFTVFAVVGVSNALNLIDGLDGLAGGVAILVMTSFALLGLHDNNQLLVILAAGLSGAILGFLKYNFYPARIFMGDAGSLTVGFLLGFMAVLLTQIPDVTVSPMLPIIVLSLPIFDAVWVMTRRFIRGSNPFGADRSHIHHKFLDLGFGHRLTVVIIYLIMMFWSISALLMRQVSEYLLLTFLIISAVAFYLILIRFHKEHSKYKFVNRDLDKGLRTTVLFQYGVKVADSAISIVGAILIFYAILAVICLWYAELMLWPITLLIFAVGIAMRPWLQKIGDFRLLLVYVTFFLMSFTVWSQETAILFGFSLKRIGDTLLFLAALLATPRLFFYRGSEFLLDTVDYLVLIIMAFMSIATQQSGFFNVDFSGPLLRAIALIIVGRIFASRGIIAHQFMISFSLIFLGIFSVLGILKLNF